jgi:CBS domain-containing protein
MPILDAHERVLGVVSRSDLLRVGTLHYPSEGRPVLSLPDRPVREVMTKPAFTIAPSTSVAEAAGHLLDEQIHRLYLQADERLIGVLSTKDVMRAILQKRLSTPIGAFMTSPVHAVDASTSLAEATDLLRRSSFHGLVVMQGSESVGIFTQLEALEARDRSPDTRVEQIMGYSLLRLPLETPVYRASGQALSMRVRRILAMEGDVCRGILTGINLAGAAALN